jgi:hypothetical protein
MTLMPRGGVRIAGREPIREPCSVARACGADVKVCIEVHLQPLPAHQPARVRSKLYREAR